jgi:teichuronic acid exporter
VAVWMALRGYGVWALGWQVLVASVMTTIGYWLSSRWRPRFTLRASSVRKLYSFGVFMMGSALLDNIYGRLYTLLVARWFGPADVGYYSRADGTQQLPASVLSGIVARVSLPVFSEAAGDPGRLRRGVQLSLRGLMLLNVPAMAGLAAIAEPVVVGIFGAKWAPSVPVLRILCLSGIFWPIHIINLNVLLAQGHPQAFFRLDVVKKAIGLCFLAVGVSFGIEGVAWSVVAIGIVGLRVNTYYTGKLLGYGLADQVRDVIPVFAAALPMAISVYWLSQNWSVTPLVKVATLSLAGALAYGATCKAFRVQALSDALLFLAPVLDRLRR